MDTDSQTLEQVDEDTEFFRQLLKDGVIEMPMMHETSVPDN